MPDPCDTPRLLLVEAPLTLDPEWLAADVGPIVPMWLDGPDLAADRQVLPALIVRFLDVVRAARPADHVVGTIGGRVIDDACDVGAWHFDPGYATRYVATVHASGTPCGHEFLDTGVLPSGVVAEFTGAMHRRPRVAAGRRVFLTAATYPDRASAFLDCAPLRSLASAGGR